jgi:hypothetical protein
LPEAAANVAVGGGGTCTTVSNAYDDASQVFQEAYDDGIYTCGSGNTYHRATCYVVLSTAATTSSTLPNCDIKYTDVNSATAVTKNIAPTGSLIGTSNALGSSLQGSMMFEATSGDVVQYDTGGSTAYVSNGATAMQDAVHVKLE